MSKEKMCEQCKNCICKSCVQVAWLQEMLKEIKEIAEKEVYTRMLFADKESFCDFNTILEKISEVE